MSGRKTVKDVSSRVSLGAVVRSRAGKTPARGEARYWGGDVPWLTAKDLKRHRLESSLERITSIAVGAGAPLAAPNDVLILVRGMTLLKDVPVGLVTRPVSFNQDVRCLHPTRRLDGAYLAYVLAAGREQLRALVTQAGHGTGRLDADALKAWVFHLPPRGVQRWIAKCLEQADEALDRTEALVAAKRVFKRALMNDLLTGRRRFPEFATSGTWSKTAIGSILEVTERPVVWDDDAEYRLVSIRRRNGGFFDREVKRGSSIKTKGLYAIVKGDFVVSRMQAAHGAMAYVGQRFDGALVSGMYLTLTPRDGSEVTARFFDYASRLPYMYRNVLTSSHGVHIEKMTFDPEKYIRKTVWMPPSTAEQRGIVAFLDGLEREVEALEQQQEQYADLKRGLMQRLLSGEIEIPGQLTAASVSAEGSNDDS